MSIHYSTGTRTFGDLLKKHATCGTCSFCKQYHGQMRKYSTRHYICETCIKARADVVLPAIRKRERFQAQLDSIHANSGR